MYKNISILQSIDTLSGESIKIFPNEIISSKVLPVVTRLKQFKKVNINLLDYNSIVFKRDYALGDVVMLYPIVSYLRKLGKKVTINTSRNYFIDKVDFFNQDISNYLNKFDCILNLNGVLERDHSEPSLFDVHRLDIYLEYLNLSLDDINWKLPLTFSENENKKYVGFQARGSTFFKGFRNNNVLLNLLETNKILLIDKNTPNFKHPNLTHKQLKLSELLQQMSNLKGLICFDSGLFWLSHVVNIPAFVIVGPTSGIKITKYHPNNKTIFYDTKEDIGCKTCGESGIRCNRSFKCMINFNEDRLINNIKKWIETL